MQLLPHPHSQFLRTLGRNIVFCVLGFLPFVPVFLNAAEVYVDAASGDDTHDGKTPATAMRTISAAIPKLGPGDTLVVAPGRYYARPIVLENLPSTTEKPITLLARPAGGATISGAWPEAAEGKLEWTLFEKDIYKATRQPAEYATMGGWNGHFLYPYRSLEELRQRKATNVHEGGKIVDGPPWGFTVEDDTYYLRLPEGADPNGEKIIFTSAWDSRPWVWDWPFLPILDVKNSPGLVIDGFRFEGNPVGIRYDEASHSATVRNCIFEYVRDGALFSHNSTMEWSELTFPGFREIFETLAPAANKDRERPLNVMFPLIKDHPIEGGIAISNPAIEGEVTGAELRYNFVHQVFDGTQLGRFSDSVCHHSVFVDCFDNAIELSHGWPGQVVRNLRVHDNLFYGKFHGILEHNQQSSKATLEGPHYVYRNVIISDAGPNWPGWVITKSKLPDEMSGVYYYHNLIWAEDGTGLLYWIRRKEEDDKHLSKLHYVNNILLFPARATTQVGAAQLDYNLLVAENPTPHFTGPNGIQFATMAEAGLEGLSLDQLSMLPPPAAVDAGKPIPGFNDDFEGTAPDIGPWEKGNFPGKDWPRPARRLIQTGPIGSKDSSTLKEPAAAGTAWVIDAWSDLQSKPYRHGVSAVNEWTRGPDSPGLLAGLPMQIQNAQAKVGADGLVIDADPKSLGRAFFQLPKNARKVQATFSYEAGNVPAIGITLGKASQPERPEALRVLMLTQSRSIQVGERSATGENLGSSDKKRGFVFGPPLSVTVDLDTKKATIASVGTPGGFKEEFDLKSDIENIDTIGFFVVNHTEGRSHVSRFGNLEVQVDGQPVSPSE